MVTRIPLRARPVGSLVAVLSGVSACCALGGIFKEWQASSGQTPEAFDPAWMLFSGGDPERAVLADDILTLSTSNNAANAYYIQSEPSVDTSGPFHVEARIRLISGSSATTSRAPAVILVTTDPLVGGGLFIDIDEVFFSTGNNTPGPRVGVDTTMAFHTYRIEYDGIDGLRLLYDGEEILTGSTFTSLDANGQNRRILWGEGSTFAFGQSQWEFFRHSAGATRSDFAITSILVVGEGMIELVWKSDLDAVYDVEFSLRPDGEWSVVSREVPSQGLSTLQRVPYQGDRGYFRVRQR